MMTRLSRLFTTAAPSKANDIPVFAPLSGMLLPLEEVTDAAFAQKMLGDGLAIIPDDSLVLAPFDGSVVATVPSGHAIGLISPEGLGCLIHVGIDTVVLQGQGFRLLVEQGQAVRKGMPLIELDLAFLRNAHQDLATPIVVTNGADWQIHSLCQHPRVTAGSDILFTARKC